MFSLLHEILSNQGEIVALITTQGTTAMAAQQDALAAIATLHTSLTSAVDRVNAFQQSQADAINSLKDQIAALQAKVDGEDFPDDVLADINAMKATADSIDTAPIQPDPVPNPNPDQPPNPDVPPVPDPNNPPVPAVPGS